MSKTEIKELKTCDHSPDISILQQFFPVKIFSRFIGNEVVFGNKLNEKLSPSSIPVKPSIETEIKPLLCGFSI